MTDGTVIRTSKELSLIERLECYKRCCTEASEAHQLLTEAISTIQRLERDDQVHWKTRRSLLRELATFKGEDGPGEEDGPWAEGWEARIAGGALELRRAPASETRACDPETMRKLLVEARSYIQSFASLTKHPTAPKDASNLVARIQAALRPQAPKIDCDHRRGTDDSGEFCSTCGERIPPAQKAGEQRSLVYPDSWPCKYPRVAGSIAQDCEYPNCDCEPAESEPV